ncbi:MAG: hypothetical protein FJY83_03965 [Candidatus Aminicenantes bacterium]|nr:hypothetical protein [Candidatus Aminicenantes bacterium]
MSKKFSLPQLGLLLLLSFLGAFFVDFCRGLNRWSVLDRSWSPDPLRILLLALLIFPCFFCFWALYSWLTRKTFDLDYGRSLGRDLLTYLPMLAFLPAPLMLRHYLTVDDLRARLVLLGVGVLLAVLYLKAVHIGRWHGERKAWGGAVAAWWSKLSLKKRAALLFAAAVLVTNAGSLRLSSAGVAFSGDEPHYLLITHSLLHDGDFNLKNNYAARDYDAFMPPGILPLEAHVHDLPEKNAAYSFHSPGVSFLMLPFYAAGEALGRRGLILLLRLGMSLLGAAFVLQLYLFARREFQREGPALGLWAVACLSSPVFFYSLHIYPEMPVAFLSLWLFRLARHGESFTAGKLLLAGAALASFVWFHAIKYPLLLVPLFLYLVWSLVRRHGVRWRLAWLLAGSGFIGGLYLFFQKSLYGSLSFSTVSWQGPMSGAESLSFIKQVLGGIPFRFRWETLAGYFLDQKDGLLLYAPVFFFAFLGMVVMARRKARDLLLLIGLAAPYILVQAFLTQRTGYAPQARPLVSAVWALAIPLGWFLAHNTKKLFSSLFALAAVLSLAAVGLLLLQPAALYQETTQGATERGGALFLGLSNLHFQLSDFLPSYLKTADGGWKPNFIWPGLLLLFLLVYALWPGQGRPFRFGAHVALATAGAGVLFFWLALYPRDVLRNPVRMSIPGAGRVGFFNLSRAARPSDPPGRFLLLQDGRAYNFYFASGRPLEALQFEVGSDRGDYALKLALFDHAFHRGRTRRDFRTITYNSPPAYPWKRSFLYRVSIDLQKRSAVSTGENPYRFELRPVVR